MAGSAQCNVSQPGQAGLREIIIYLQTLKNIRHGKEYFRKGKNGLRPERCTMLPTLDVKLLANGIHITKEIKIIKYRYKSQVFKGFLFFNSYSLWPLN